MIGAPVSRAGLGPPPSKELGQPWPPEWWMHLERTHDLTQRAGRSLESIAEPPLDLSPAAKGLERALIGLYVVFDDRGDRFEAAGAAQAGLTDARAALASSSTVAEIAQALSSIDDALKALAAAWDAIARQLPSPPRVFPEIVGSKSVPNLHALPRPSIEPKLKVGAPPPPPPAAEPPLKPPETLEELDEMVEEVKRRAEARGKELTAKDPPEPPATSDELEGPEGFLPYVSPAKTEAQWIADKARECFEEVAMLGLQRTPLLGDPFRTSLILEQRLVKALDALVSLGPRAIALVEPMVLDAPAKDPSRAFGAAMVLGCIEGRDALAAAERAARFCGCADEPIGVAYAGALKLVPHPALPTSLRVMLHDPDPVYRAIALEVLVYRRLHTPEELVNALADTPEIAAIALPQLALEKYPYLQQALDPALESEHPKLREAAWTAMALSGHDWTVNVLEKELHGPLAERAAIHLGLVVEHRDAERLFERTQETPTEARVAALGWAGLSPSIPWLIGLLSAQKTPGEVKIAAAYALDRMTGARLYESILVDPEQMAFPEIPEPDVGEPKPKPLARVVSDPRDLPSPGTPDSLMRPTLDAERWKAWWLDRREFFDSKLRYRRGHPYSPVVSLWELDGWIVPPAERRLLQREMVVRTGEWVPFDPHDWVVVQEESLKAWEPLARKAASPGSWARVRRK